MMGTWLKRNSKRITQCGFIFSTWFAAQAFAAGDLQLRIGISLPSSGPLQVYGKEMHQGIELALRDFQAAEPKLARQITLIKGDDQGDVTRAEEAVQKLIKMRKVHIIVGSLAAYTNQKLSQIARDLKTPIILPASVDPTLMNNNPYVYMPALTTKQQGTTLAQFATKFLKRQRAALLIRAEDEYAQQIAKSFADDFVKTGGVIAKATAIDAKADPDAQLQELVAAKPEFVVFPSTFPEHLTWLEKLRQAGFRGAILGGDSWDTPNLWNHPVADAVKGLYFVSQYSPVDQSPFARRFINRYQELFNARPTAFAALGYEAMQLILAAHRRNTSGTTEGLMAQLDQASNVTTLGGYAQVDGSRMLLKTGTMLYSQKNSAQFVARF